MAKGGLSCTKRGRIRPDLSSAEMFRRAKILDFEIKAREDAMKHCKDETNKDHLGQILQKRIAKNNCIRGAMGL